MSGITSISDGSYLLGIRPEKISMSPTAGVGVRAYVAAVEHLGGETVIGFGFRQGARDRLVNSLPEQAVHYAKVPGTAHLEVGSEQWFSFETDAVTWFDPESGESLASRDEALAH
jgi:ABC-type sugar transport system ATPase subunit